MQKIATIATLLSSRNPKNHPRLFKLVLTISCPKIKICPPFTYAFYTLPQPLSLPLHPPPPNTLNGRNCHSHINPPARFDTSTHPRWIANPPSWRNTKLRTSRARQKPKGRRSSTDVATVRSVLDESYRKAVGIGPGVGTGRDGEGELFLCRPRACLPTQTSLSRFKSAALRTSDAVTPAPCPSRPSRQGSDGLVSRDSSSSLPHWLLFFLFHSFGTMVSHICVYTNDFSLWYE